MVGRISRGAVAWICGVFGGGVGVKLFAEIALVLNLIAMVVAGGSEDSSGLILHGFVVIACVIFSQGLSK